MNRSNIAPCGVWPVAAAQSSWRQGHAIQVSDTYIVCSRPREMETEINLLLLQTLDGSSSRRSLPFWRLRTPLLPVGEPVGIPETLQKLRSIHDPGAPRATSVCRIIRSVLLALERLVGSRSIVVVPQDGRMKRCLASARSLLSPPGGTESSKTQETPT